MSTAPIVPATPASPYDAAIDHALDQQDQQQNELLMQSMSRAAGGDANLAGEAQRLGFQTGVGPDIARTNMAEVRRRAQLADVQQRQLSFTSPILARQLTDPHFAEIAHDNLDNLGDTEKAFQWVKQNNPIRVTMAGGVAPVFSWSPDVAGQWEAGQLQHEMGLLGFKAGTNAATPEDWTRLSQIRQRLQQIGPQQSILGGVANMAGQMKDMGVGALTAGSLGGLAVGGATALASGGLATEAVPEAAGLGFKFGAEVFASQDIYRMTSGQAYLDMLDKGVNEATARYASAGVGAINTALMMGGAKLATAPFGRAVNALIGEKLADQLVRPTVARAVMNAAGQWALSSAEGGAAMAGQTVVSQIGEDLAKSYDKGQLQTVLSTPEGREEFAGRVADSFVTGLLLTGMVGGAGSMLHLHAELGRAAEGQRAAGFFEALTKNASESDVRKRNPNAYESFIAAQADGSPAEHVYVDGQKMSEIFNQSGIEPEKLDEALPGVRAQAAAAAATGGDVVIPTAQYAAKLAGTDLGRAMLPHMRLDPDAMSVAEATDFAANHKALLEEAQQRAVQEMATSESFAQSAKAVESDILQQLKATKTMPEDVARVNAQFMRDLIVTQAADLKITPEEFYQRYKPTIERAAGGALNQSELGEENAGAPTEGGFVSRLKGFFQSPKERARQRRNMELARIQGEMLKGTGEPGVAEQVTKLAARGGFDPARLTILLNDKADFSTFAHETAHWYLTVLGSLAKDENTSGRFKIDMGRLLDWFGVKDQATWDAMSIEEQRKHHEQFAYSFEKYLAEGKAPSLELQPVFDRFKMWLQRVYQTVRDDINSVYRKQHGADLPIMTGEVRQVMDRMLASDEQIRHAQAVRSLEPLFDSKETALRHGMTEADWDEYTQHVAAAREQATAELGAASLRNMQWLSNARSRVMKEMQEQHDELRAETRAEVEKEVTGEDLYRAQRWLKTGEMETPGGETVAAEKGYKLNADDVKAMFAGKPGAPDLTKLRGMMDAEGMHPDVAAPMFGFDNGEQLVRNLADARSIKEEVDARTDQRMLERHGDMNSPEELERRTNEALHNDARARMLATELKFVQRLGQPVRVLQRAAENVAQRILSEKRIGDISEHEFIAGEARAERAAQVAMRKGDDAGVAKAVQDRLLQNALAKEAMKARAEVDQKLQYLGKFDRPSKAVTMKIGADYMDRINELLAGYQLSQRAAMGSDARPMADWVNAEYAKTGVMPSVSDELITDLGNMHWKDMTLEQLRGLHDAVKSLDYIGRRRTQIEIEGKTVQVDELIKQVQDTLADVKHTEPVDIRADLQHAKGLDKVQARFLQLKGKLRSMDAALLKMEQLSQWLDAGKEAGAAEAPIDGPMSRLFRLASNSEGKERSMRAVSAAALRELGKKLRGSGIDLNEELDVPELPRQNRGTKMYREELLAVALNMGNESNREKLLTGYQWSDLRVQSAVNRLLSKPELDFVQGVWDHVGTYGKDIVELQRRQTGVTPKMITPAVFETTHGVYRGGYYPVVYDSFLDRSIEEKEARRVDQLFENNYANPSTNKGATIERTGYKGPIYLALDVIARHIDQVTHDLSWREAIIDMNKVLTDPRLQREVEETYGREYAKQFRPWLQAMANDRVFNTTGDAAWESLIRKARTNATMVGVGFRLSTMEVHGASALSNSIGEVGPKWFAKGLQQFMGIDRIQQARDFVYERSPEMAHRMDAVDRNIAEAINQINEHQRTLGVQSAAGRVVDQARKFGLYGVSMVDMASAMPTWLGAYLKGMAKEADGGLNLAEQDAIEYANRAVRNAHGGGGTKDLSALQRDKGVMSLATMFYSFWNHMYNRQRDLAKGWGAVATGQAGTNNLPRLLARSWFYFVVPQIAHALLKPSAKKGDEGDGLADFATRTAEEIALGTVSGVPIVRDLANAYVNGRDYTVTPLEQAGKSLVMTARDATHLVTGEPLGKHAFQNTANTAGYVFGIPTAQPAATTKFLWDVVDGNADPQGMKDWWEGVMTGRIKP